MPVANAQHFHPQHWNAIAKDIREEYKMVLEVYDRTDEREWQQAQLRAIEELALKFAKRFTVDNSQFDPYVFLEHCSPDTDLYLISALWDGNDA